MKSESELIEYKLLGADGRLPDSFIKEVVAFVNSDGGTIYVGISDNGEIIGVDNPDEVKNRISNTIRDNVKPEMLMFIRIIDEIMEGKTIIKVEIKRGTERPYYISGKGIRPEGVYLRRGSSSIPANESTIKEMLMETAGRSYEKERSIDQDLTFEALNYEMHQRGIDYDSSKMRTLGITGSDGLYTNLALLLSDQCPFTIKIAVFEGTDSLIFKDRREFGGSVLNQLSKSLEFIDLNNKTHAQVGPKYRDDKKDYPPEAIREALLNCIVHRDYTFSSSSIINIYSDHMEFISIGSIIPGISMEAIMLGVSQSRNSLLAQLFYRLSLVESYGTGIKKIKQLYSGCKAPEFRAETGGFFVTLYNRNETAEASDDLTVKEQSVIDYVKMKGSITRSEAENILNIKQTGAYNVLKELCQKGKLVQETEGKYTKYVTPKENIHN